MVESVGVGFKEQVNKTGEQKLTGKNSQLLSGIKIGDVLKGSLSKLENGQVVLQMEDNRSIAVKLQGMAIFNENIALEVIQKDEGQMLLKLFQSEALAQELLQNKIIKELGLPETDPMRQLIETFLAKQMPLQREGLLKNYHMHQSFQIPAEVLANLSQDTGSVSFQETRALYEMQHTDLEQILTPIGEAINEVKNSEIVKDIYNILSKYLDEETIEKALTSLNDSIEQEASAFEMQGNMEEVKHDKLFDKMQEIIASKSINSNEMQKQSSNCFNQLDVLLKKLTPETWEQLGKVTKQLLVKSMTLDINKLEGNPEESKHIESTAKILKEVLKVLEDAKLPEKYSNTLKGLEETAQIVNKFNVQGEYYFFSLALPQGEGKGELYFFKPKKKSSGGKEHLYVVLALELPRLKNIEIHMRQEQENLLLHFKVKEEGILNLLEQHLKALKQMMGQTKFNLDEIKFSLLEEKSLGILGEAETQFFNHMDFKI